MPSQNEIAAIFGALACEAGRAIMRARASGADARHKADGSPVTQADFDADRCIRDGLARVLPSLPVVTEEATETHGALTGGPFILVDPLDGTREFVAGRDEFTVNIALIENGVPIAGAIYAPALGRLYVAGTEARRAEVPSGAEMPALSAMRTIAAAPMPERGWRAVASRSHRDPDTARWLESNPVGECCAAGSSLKFCLIAEGAADVYPRLSPTMAWDTAAGHAILLAAGGRVERLDGRALRYGIDGEGFSNPAFIAWARGPAHARR
jgi:3'(2'), 5'-bisphosphate nucleotidase